MDVIKKKVKELEFIPKFRMSSFEEAKGKIKAVGELIPIYPSGISAPGDPDLEQKLMAIYKNQKSKVLNKMALALRDLAIEVWTVSKESAKAESMKGLKFKIASETATYNPKYAKLDVVVEYTPTIIPVFKDPFEYEGILIQTNLKFDTEDSSKGKTTKKEG